MIAYCNQKIDDGTHMNNLENEMNGILNITFEEIIMKSLVEEYEHQFGLECTYHEISEDKKRA